jgi:uncharacterized integral membrane protein
MSQQTSGSDGAKLGGGAIATIVGVVVLAIVLIQNRTPTHFKFLAWSFTWPLWFYTIVAALIGAFVWFGLGVMRRHRRRKNRRN